MKIELNKVVSLTYTLTKDSHEGETVEVANKEKPLRFIFGQGAMLESFENNLKDLSQGDTFKFKLTASEAYGEYMQENVFAYEKKNFEVDGKIDENIFKVGNVIPFQDKEGHQFNGTINEIKEDSVILDFNHPMAGQDLYFSGEILEIRDATESELDHGHVH